MTARARDSTRTWITVAVLSAIQAGAMIATAPARACSCTFSAGAMIWPQRDARDVPVDTPIVVERKSLSDDPSSMPIRLLDEEGVEVVLIETRRLEQLEPSCWAQQTVFLRPAEPLATASTYTVSVGEAPSQTFTTGSSERTPSHYPAPSIRYVHVGPVDSCSEKALWCDLAEVQLEFDEPIEDALWLVVRSRAHEDNENRWVYGLPGSVTSNPFPQLSVVLAEGDTCLDFTLFGIDGSVVHERELCTPDACVLHANRGASTCGDPPYSGLDIARLPRSSCDAPITIESGPEGPIYSGNDEARGAGAGNDGGDGTASEVGGGSSCSVANGPGAERAGAWFLIALGLARLGRWLARARNSS